MNNILPDELNGYVLEEKPIQSRTSPGNPIVYLATNALLKRQAAVKAWEDPATVNDDNFQKQFRRELRINDALSRPGHRNIVRFIGGGINPDEGYAYLMCDYLPNGTLKDRIDREGALSIPTALTISLQVLDALTYIGLEREIAGTMMDELAHGDGHPANIGFDYFNVAQLLDFGHSRVIQISPSIDIMLTGLSPDTRVTGMYLTPEEEDPEVSSIPADDWWRVTKVLGVSLGRNMKISTPISQLERYENCSDAERRQLEQIDEILNQVGPGRVAMLKNYNSPEELAVDFRQILYLSEVGRLVEGVRTITSKEGLLPYAEYAELQYLRDTYEAFAREHRLPVENAEIEQMLQKKYRSDKEICITDAPLLGKGKNDEARYDQKAVLEALTGWRHLRFENTSQPDSIKA